MAEQSDTVPASDFEEWLTPPDALEALDGMGSYATRSTALVQRLAAELAIAAAETYREVRKSYRIDRSRPHWIIPKSVWDDHAPDSDHDFWDTGQFQFREPYPAETDHSYFGVRFDPKGVEALRRASGLAPATAKPERPKPKAIAGAKRKDWWDLLWIEMIKRIRAGTLQPKSKGELQQTLEDYADEIGGKYGDSTLKPMASNLFEYLQEIGGK